MEGDAEKSLKNETVVAALQREDSDSDADSPETPEQSVKGISLCMITLALMSAVFFVALDIQILGSFSPPTTQHVLSLKDQKANDCPPLLIARHRCSYNHFRVSQAR